MQDSSIMGLFLKKLFRTSARAAFGRAKPDPKSSFGQLLRWNLRFGLNVVLLRCRPHARFRLALGSNVNVNLVKKVDGLIVTLQLEKTVKSKAIKHVVEKKVKNEPNILHAAQLQHNVKHLVKVKNGEKQND